MEERGNPGSDGDGLEFKGASAGERDWSRVRNTMIIRKSGGEEGWEIESNLA
jgi:hypothetical protein